MRHVFKVKFISRSDCSFYLNTENTEKLTKNGKLTVNVTCIRVEFGVDFNSCIYSSLNSCGRDVVDDDSIGLNAVRAGLLNIEENDEVCVSVVSAPLLSKVDVRPQDDTEYQLIFQNRDVLESTILNYVQIVNIHEVVPVEVFTNVIINLKIENLHMDSKYGELQKETELVILLPSDNEGMENSRTGVSSYDMNMKNEGTTIFCKLFKWLTHVQDQTNSPTKQLMRFTSHFQKSKATPAHDKLEESLSKLCAGDDALIFRVVPWYFAPKKIQTLIQNYTVVATGLPDLVGASLPCQISRIEWSRDSTQENNISLLPTSVYALITCSSDDCGGSKDILYVSDMCMRMVNVKFGAGVRVEFVKQNQSIMLNSSDSLFLAPITEMKPCFCEGVKKIYDDVIRTVVDNIKLHQRVNTLIAGSTGSGKTYLLNALTKGIEQMHLSYRRIDCKSLRRLKVTSLEKTFRENIVECCRNLPSVMIMDDLDVLNMDDDEGNPYSALYSARIGDLIMDLITSYQSINEITFIATCTSLTKLKNISTDRGPIVFENIHEIGELDSKERCFMLESLVCRGLRIRISHSLLEEIGDKTKGYNVQDLIDLVKIADFKRLSRINSVGDEITQEDFENALKEKVPMSLCDVNLQEKTLTKWEDIGGMEETKNLLKEMLQWPLKYQQLYASCPIRLQCGVLLYGAPGTGKTLLSGAVANEFGLNFISIKGPEIFSKYVGASEQGIRDLFSRAKRAKPCLLFFDEFDSLARKRGDSNEDVNDRVVNQLLTELDGVEELTGVFILAATSRPDLLDPALLRPGRIDRAVHCKLPTQDERLAILKAMSKNVTLSDDVELREIAKKTDGYSGADLQAVLCAAQMLMVKEVSRHRAKDSYPELVLKQNHLLTGLAETKPSMSKEDRENYAARYEAFMSSRTGNSLQRLGYTQQKLMFG